MLKGQEKIITSTMEKEYGLYFNREVANLDKNYVPITVAHIVCDIYYTG